MGGSAKLSLDIIEMAKISRSQLKSIDRNVKLILDTNWLINFDLTNLIIRVQPLSHNQDSLGLIKDMDLIIHNYCIRETLISLIQYLVKLNQFLYIVN